MDEVAPERLGDHARRLIEDPTNPVLLSAASSWEIAVKFALGKLFLPESPETYVPDRMRTSGVTALAVQHSHALRVADLEHHHRDPFDRLLVAQAQIEDLVLMTADPVFGAYDVETVAA
ncbi:MAG TPA: type II toxin-antitoxin system VapC family toxin [Acidimicrobiales bacterium]|nr:type II toxin-antitoxin system VapC family toxin [Acidimicrobiales bacterium]